MYDPGDVGLVLWKWGRPNDDSQDLPSWREPVVATALSLYRHHARTLIVPMSPVRDDPGSGRSVLEWALSRMDPAGGARQPAELPCCARTGSPPAELADEVLAAGHRRFDFRFRRADPDDSPSGASEPT